jgi:hypothetical protein
MRQKAGPRAETPLKPKQDGPIRPIIYFGKCKWRRE